MFFFVEMLCMLIREKFMPISCLQWEATINSILDSVRPPFFSESNFILDGI